MHGLRWWVAVLCIMVILCFLFLGPMSQGPSGSMKNPKLCQDQLTCFFHPSSSTWFWTSAFIPSQTLYTTWGWCNITKESFKTRNGRMYLFKLLVRGGIKRAEQETSFWILLVSKWAQTLFLVSFYFGSSNKVWWYLTSIHSATELPSVLPF